MQSMLSLSGQVALVTGSSRGIGWAIARLLAEHGASVIVNGHSDPVAVEKKAAELSEAYGIAAVAMPFDAADPAAIRECYKSIFARFKRLDVLVNNAGILQNGVIGMITEQHIRDVFAINTVAVLHHTQEAARLMGRNKSGAIVNLSSIAGQAGSEGQMVYAASKSALIGLTRSAAKELAPRGIRVNAVAPGIIKTDLLAALPEAKLQQNLAAIRMGRFGEPEDVAKTVLFLCSDLASYITGQVIGVDGGMAV